jgi:hypothetical protein
MTTALAHTCVDRPHLPCDACETTETQWKIIIGIAHGLYIDELMQWKRIQKEKNEKMKRVLERGLRTEQHYVQAGDGRYTCNDPSVCLRCAMEELIKTL